MYRTLAVSAAVLVATGCSSMQPGEQALIEAQLAQPTFRIECPTQGCNFSRFEYFDPNKKVDLPTNGYDVANNAMRHLSSVLLGVAPYVAIAKGFEYMNGSSTTTSTQIEANSSTSETVTTSTDVMVSDSYNQTTTDTSTVSETPLIFLPPTETP
jgi:hypothetical protein